MFKLDLEKRGTRDKIANIRRIIRKAKEFQKNIYFYFIDYAKVFDCVYHNKLWKIIKEMWMPDHLTCLLKNLCACQEWPLEPDLEQQTGSYLGREYVKAVYCHSACLTYTENTSCKMPGWIKQAGIKIARRNISNLRLADDTTLMAESK